MLLHNDIRAQNSYNLVNTLGAHYQELFCSKGNRWLKLESLDGELDKLKLQGLEDVATKLAAKDLMGALSRLNLKAGMTQILEEMKGSSGFDFVVNGLVDAKLWAGNEVENLKHSVSSILVDPNEEFKETLHNGNSIYNQIRSLITDAETSIDVCTPYVFVAKNERECLKRWVMQKPGRHIRLLSNSAATSDSALTITSFDRETAPGLMLGNTYECHYPKIVNGQPVIENGKPVEIVDKGEFDNHDLKIRVYELGRMDNKLFAGETIDGKPALASYFYGKLHAKFGIIDGKFSFVGSDNLDPRSRHLNSETTMFVESEYIAGDFTQAFETLVSRSYLYGSPELEQMQKLKAVQKRIKSMNRLDKLFKKIPISGFAN